MAAWCSTAPPGKGIVGVDGEDLTVTLRGGAVWRGPELASTAICYGWFGETYLRRSALPDENRPSEEVARGPRH
jgi:hypothetical protein